MLCPEPVDNNRPPVTAPAAQWTPPRPHTPHLAARIQRLPLPVAATPLDTASSTSIDHTDRVTVCTFNVQSLSNGSSIPHRTKLQELIQFSIDHKIDMMAIQEHRLVFTDAPIRTCYQEGWGLLYASAETGNNTVTGGVGWLV